MSKSKVTITAGAVLLSAALAVILLNVQLSKQSFQSAREAAVASERPSAIQPDSVWTYNRDLPVQRPEIILLTCADGGLLVTDIQWETWSAKGATGTGIYSENLCEPDCATGERRETSVGVQLSDLLAYRGRNILKILNIHAHPVGPLPNRPMNITWDLADYSKKMG